MTHRCILLWLLLGAPLVLGCPEAGSPGPTVECDTVPAGADLLGELDHDGDGRLTDEDLEDGEAAMVLTGLGAGAGSGITRSLRTDTELRYNTQMDGDPTWGTWHRLGCEPEAAAFHWFHDEQRAAVLSPGTGDARVFAFDVPDYEQMCSTDDYASSGQVVITEANPDRLSGYFDGHAECEIEDLLSQSLTGQLVTVEAFAFRAIAGSPVP